MHNDVVQLLAKILATFMVVLMPLLVVTFTDRFRQQPTVRDYSILFGLAATVGILLFLPAISIVAGTALLALAIAWATSRYSLRGVTYSRNIVPERLFPGDSAELHVHLRNGKLLPLAWLNVVDPIHLGLVRPGDSFEDLLLVSGGVEILDDLMPALVNRTAMGPYQAVDRVYRVNGLKRGIYSLGPTELESGDAFGILRESTTLGERLDIIVYPRIYSPDEIGIPFREALGNATTRRALVEDPTLMAGSREYQPGDPLHRMHWKATARTGDLQVRVSDPSTTAQIMLLLNLNTFQYLWQGVDLDRMEAAIEVAASIATWAVQHDFAVGVRSNGVVPGQENTPRIAASADPRQSVLIMEHLARLHYSGRFSPEEILLDEARRLSMGETIVFVTPILTPTLINVLVSRRLSGRVSVVYCGRFAAPVVRGLPIYLSTPPREPASAIS